MAAGQGQIIQVADFNSIHSKFYNVFSKGSGSSGYGQEQGTDAVTEETIITTESWSKLRDDMIKARQHQLAQTIGSSGAIDGLNLLPITQLSPITEEIRNQFNLFADAVVTDKFVVHPTQLIKKVLISNKKTNTWNRELTITFNVFSSSFGDGSFDNFRYFFNAGGRLELTASRTGGTDHYKNQYWSTMLDSIGIITFDYAKTQRSGSRGISNPIGFHSLTETDQVLFSFLGTGIYVNDHVKLLGRLESDKLVLTLLLSDESDADPQDLDISGILSTELVTYTPSGTNVAVFALTASGTEVGLATPGYIVSPVPPSVSEGGTVQIQIQSTEAASKTLYWTTGGNVISRDFDDDTLVGSIVLDNSGKATLTRSISPDRVTEPTPESFIIYFRIASYTGKIIGSTSPIQISDTSQYTFSVDKTSVKEGEMVTWTCQSSNAANNVATIITTVSGVSTLEFDIGPNSGSGFSNGMASGVYRVISDYVADGNQTFYIQFRENSHTGAILGTSPPITIIDTSKTATITLTPNTPKITSNTIITYTISTRNIANGEQVRVYAYGDASDTWILPPTVHIKQVQNGTVTGTFQLKTFENFFYDWVTDKTKPGYIVVYPDISGHPEICRADFIAHDNRRKVGHVSYTTYGTYSWTVPNEVAKVRVTVIGGRGGRGGDDSFSGASGLFGSKVVGILSVSPGQIYTLHVGGSGGSGSNGGGVGGGRGGASTFDASGGYGGSSAPEGTSGSGGGGGAASVIALGTTPIVAAGGGGGGGGGGHYSGAQAAGRTYGGGPGGVNKYRGGNGTYSGDDGGGGGGGGGGVNPPNVGGGGARGGGGYWDGGDGGGSNGNLGGSMMTALANPILSSDIAPGITIEWDTTNIV